MSGVNADYRPPAPRNYWTRYDDDPDFIAAQDFLKLPHKRDLIELWGRYTPEQRAAWVQQMRDCARDEDG